VDLCVAQIIREDLSMDWANRLGCLGWNNGPVVGRHRRKSRLRRSPFFAGVSLIGGIFFPDTSNKFPVLAEQGICP
jgi:hypothetical protein